MKIPSQSKLDARCKYWQRRLRLQDWHVKVKFARLSDMGESTLGRCFPGQSKREADIQLLHRDDVAGQEFWHETSAMNWERTLVHELLHLHMKDVLPGWRGGTNRAKYRAAERMIDALASALVP